MQKFSYLNKLVLNNKIVGLGLLLFLLTGCAPQFKIESNYNKFRGTNVCKMENNNVKKHSLRGFLSDAFVSFDLEENTEYRDPYSLVVKVVSNNIPPVFRRDSYANIMLTRNGQYERIKLQAFDAMQDHSTVVNSSPGYVTSSGVYIAGSVYNTTTYFSKVYFHLTKAQMLKLTGADELSFEVEAHQAKPLEGTLGKQNIDNLRAFREKCQ